MALEMKSACESCQRAIEISSTAYICSYECTYCPVCRAKWIVCPNCHGELTLRPRRPAQVASNATQSKPLPTNEQNLTPIAPYQPRTTRLVSLHSCLDWKLKVYEICFADVSIPSEQIEQTLAFVDQNVPWLRCPGHSPRAGFVLVHRGRDAMWLMVHLWQADILSQFAFQSPLSNPVDFTPLRSDGFCGCVWELEVVSHERDAWIRCEMGSNSNSIARYWNDNFLFKLENR
jgi:hypothetical protein